MTHKLATPTLTIPLVFLAFGILVAVALILAVSNKNLQYVSGVSMQKMTEPGMQSSLSLFLDGNGMWR